MLSPCGKQSQNGHDLAPRTHKTLPRDSSQQGIASSPPGGKIRLDQSSVSKAISSTGTALGEVTLARNTALKAPGVRVMVPEAPEEAV